ncbi:MAG: hypothetical protein Q8J72_08280 [Rhodocyclaceae bacterium]|nr:hypothetical protein [Rhodocyclaceae bacterium]
MQTTQGRLITLIAAAGISFPTYAEGPMATDDAGTLDIGGMKVEVVLGRDDKTRSAELGFGFGLIENVEIGLGFARETDRTADPSAKLRGTGIGIKWVPIQNDTGWSLGMSFGYGKTRVDDRFNAEKFTEREYALTGLASYRLENNQVLHLNLGAVRVKAQGESDTVRTWNIGYEFPLVENLQLTVETYGAEHSRPDKAIGLRYEVFDGFKVSAAVGRGNDRGFGQVGLAWEF